MVIYVLPVSHSSLISLRTAETNLKQEADVAPIK
jgi:hypothetical protein